MISLRTEKRSLSHGNHRRVPSLVAMDRARFLKPGRGHDSTMAAAGKIVLPFRLIAFALRYLKQSWNLVSAITATMALFVIS